VGKWYRLRRDETNRRTDCWRHDHVDDSRPYIGARVLRDYEGASTEERNYYLTLRNHVLMRIEKHQSNLSAVHLPSAGRHV
jgi:hypothetical protein